MRTSRLSVLIHQHLTWKSHVDNVWRGLYVSCVLCTVWGYCQVICCFNDYHYQAFILPIFDYCDAVLAPTAVSLLKPRNIYTLQVPATNSFVRLTLAEQRHFHTAVLSEGLVCVAMLRHAQSTMDEINIVCLFPKLTPLLVKINFLSCMELYNLE